MIIYTVQTNHLIKSADSLEQYAKGSLPAWILLGQVDRYAEAMRAAAALRAAAAERSIWVRREILRNSGFEIRRAREAARV